MYYFYCPNCFYEEEVLEIPRGTVPNIRDGFGKPIRHYECPKCTNLDAGYMRMDKNGEDKEEEKKYYQHVIGLYQNIKGLRTITKE